jgi:hypothetical protein
MRAMLAAVLVVSQALPGGGLPVGGLEVEVANGVVSVRANRVPLARILDRLAQQTGMKVTYESGHPSQPVTAALEGLVPRDAVTRLLEGLGLSYVFRTDASGLQVETLIVSDGGSGSGSQVATRSAPPPPSSDVEYTMEMPDEMAEEYEEPPAMEIPPPGQPVQDLVMPGSTAQPPGVQFPGQTFPGQQFPGQQFPGQQFPGQQPPGPAFPGQGAPQGIPQPEFPGPVSNPFQ